MSPGKLVVVAVLAAVYTAVQTPVRDATLRRVEGRTLNSPSSPRATLEVSEGFRYVGGQRFVLYGLADAEQHFFVDAGSDRVVHRLYWMQFESYLPDNDRYYQYTSPDVRHIGPLEFIVDVLTQPRPSRPDSDSAHMRAFLEQHGLTLTDRANTVRFAHMADAAKRSELLIIYRESLGASQEASTPEGLIARGLAGIAIR
jgi:hypothetical protein